MNNLLANHERILQNYLDQNL